MTFGQYAIPTFHGSKCIVCWGGNPVASVPIAGDPMLIMKSKGQAKLLVIDPRKAELGKAADIHAMILPGIDPAFGMGLVHVIISENLYDKGFVEKWTIGFDELAVAVKEYTRRGWQRSPLCRRMSLESLPGPMLPPSQPPSSGGTPWITSIMVSRRPSMYSGTDRFNGQCGCSRWFKTDSSGMLQQGPSG